MLSERARDYLRASIQTQVSVVATYDDYVGMSNASVDPERLSAAFLRAVIEDAGVVPVEPPDASWDHLVFEEVNDPSTNQLQVEVPLWTQQGPSDVTLIYNCLVTENAEWQDYPNGQASLSDVRVSHGEVQRRMAVLPTRSALHVAASVGDAAGVRRELSTGHDVEDREHGFSAMQHAACRGHIECVQVLLEAGAQLDPTASDRAGGSMHEGPLQLACEGGHLEVARVLLAAGANVNRTAASGRSALTYACWAREQHPDLVKMLRDHGADPSGLPRRMAWARHQLGGVDLLSDLEPPAEEPADSVVGLLSESELEAVVQAVRAIEEEDVERLGTMTSSVDDLFQFTHHYGRWNTVEVIAPPGDPATWRMDVYRWDEGRGASVDLPVWTQQEGPSDLTLSLDIESHGDGVVVRLESLHVH